MSFYIDKMELSVPLFTKAIELISYDDLNMKDEKGWTILHYAAKENNYQIVDMLIEAGLDVNVRTNSNSTPMLIAAHHGHLEFLTKLIFYKANPNLSKIGGLTPLMFATKHNHIYCVELLLKNGADVNLMNDTLDNAFSIAVQEKNKRIVNLLHSYHSDFQIVDLHGNTPMLHAVFNDDLEMVKFLMIIGVDFAKENIKGISPIKAALCVGNVQIFKILAKNYKNIQNLNINGYPLIYSILLFCKNPMDLIVYLVKENKCDLNMVVKFSNLSFYVTPLSFAYMKGREDVFNFLLVMGAEPNLRESEDSLTYLDLMVEYLKTN